MCPVPPLLGLLLLPFVGEALLLIFGESLSASVSVCFLCAFSQDVLLKDVGGLRAEDGRWPFVIDPSGRTSTFIKYSGAAAPSARIKPEKPQLKKNVRFACEAREASGKPGNSLLRSST